MNTQDLQKGDMVIVSHCKNDGIMLSNELLQVTIIAKDEQRVVGRKFLSAFQKRK